MTPPTDRIARAHEARLYRALLRVFASLQNQAKLTAYTRAVEQGNVDAALQALGLDKLPQRLIDG